MLPAEIASATVFYFFASVTLLASMAVVGVRNPVHSVFFLILTFFSGAGLFMLRGAEFISLILVIVYVGAVAVLFLFVVMMMDTHFATIYRERRRYLPVGLGVAALLFLELLVAIWYWRDSSLSSLPGAGEVTNTEGLGLLIYTDYILSFQIAGAILLLAMMGAILLTLRRREGVRRQNIPAQLQRRPEETVELLDIPPGEGM